ncbi:Methyltransferase type 11 [Candidatus Thiomargarita nelsonii]|uniref:Methyltransferase type 11 n=1 Tax=Candidatus Thiomargarita nelsonii TaxID=1003181 RepID=A0A176S5C1_9GAMM|nr:Methyltransferase type 11 [Candidatus Thiomargarita nelsonii]
MKKWKTTSMTVLPFKYKYDKTEKAFTGYYSFLEKLILDEGAIKICDVGGGANPSLSPKFIEKHGLDYTVLDISADELKKAPDVYRKVQADIGDPNLIIDGEYYDLVFSRMLAEHVKRGYDFHNNILKMLSPNGVAFHFFPTLFALPFLVNYLLPERVAYELINVLQPKIRLKEGNKAKFPAYYSWCFGPLAHQIGRFEKLGYQVEEYWGFYGHDGYYGRLKLLLKLHQHTSNYLVKHPIPWLTDFAYVILRKKAITETC